jgi:hypothetical protein
VLSDLTPMGDVANLVAVARKRDSVCVMFMGWGIALDRTMKCCFSVMADWAFSVGVSVLCSWSSGVWIHSLGVFEDEA